MLELSRPQRKVALRKMSKSKGQWNRIVEAIPEPDVFLDFGPGKINSEAWIAKDVWPNCSIIGVEACKNRHAKLKNYPGRLIHAAVDEGIGQADGYVGGRFGMFMFGEEKYQGNARTAKANLEKVSVQTVTVDQLYEGGTVFIWADIEGAELRMLKGATSLLSSGQLLALNLELWPQNAQKIWPNYTGERCTADQVIDFLSRYDIECRGSRQRPDLIHGDFESKDWFTDFLFVKGA